MRPLIQLDDRLVAELDRRAGRRRRSASIAMTVERALDDERRRQAIESALGALPDDGHEWDADPAGWVGAGGRADRPRLAELLLDTTVLIDALRGRAARQLRQLRAGGPPPYVCAVNVEEIWRGIRPGEEVAARTLLGALRPAPPGRRARRTGGPVALRVRRRRGHAEPGWRPATRATSRWASWSSSTGAERGSGSGASLCPRSGRLGHALAGRLSSALARAD
jgi:predicted nucleic acid-binding protein